MSNSNWTLPNFPNLSGLQPEADIARDVYQLAVPIMLVACLVTMLFNLLILESAHWVRRTLSPTLCFSLSLSVANAYASLVIAVGLIVNSLLPTVYDVQPPLCMALTLEAFRLTGLIASVLHLLALAVNHYIGITRPLHYAATVTKRAAWMAIAGMWLVPLAFFLIYFSSVHEQGFQSSECRYDFILCRPFRMTVSGLFFFPLVAMTVIYGHIFIIVRRHQRGSGITVSLPGQLRRSVKAVFTTLLILGTYLLGWMPAVIFYVLTCLDCTLPIVSVPLEVRLTFGILTNSLVLLKSLADPVIYVLRMPEIKIAFKQMWLSRCGLTEVPRAGSDLLRMHTRTSEVQRLSNGLRKEANKGSSVCLS